MLRDEILRKLRAEQAILATEFGVGTIAVFGSVVRGEANLDSDVDILVEYQADKTPGLFGFVSLQLHLEELLGRKVDLTTPDGLHPALKDDILRETVYA